MFAKHDLRATQLTMQKQLEFAELIWVRVAASENRHFCVCVCYHPPKPRYNSAELVETLHDNLNELLVLYPCDVYVVAGDLNQLRYNVILTDFGLSQLVNKPTRKDNILDVFITNRPDLFNCNVAKSVLKSDHLAVYVNCACAASSKRADSNTARKQVKCYNRSPADMARLVQFFANYNWNGLTLAIDNGTSTVDQVFADFVNILHHALNNVLGYKTVTIREQDPPYITPSVRVLLRKRNKLLRRGKTDLAEPITRKIGKLITNARTKLLSKASASDTRQLWQLLRRTHNWSRGNASSTVEINGHALTANDLNAYFTEIATDPHYSDHSLEEVLQSLGDSDLSSFNPFSAEFITTILSRVRATSPGPEEIPYWL